MKKSAAESDTAIQCPSGQTIAKAMFTKAGQYLHSFELSVVG